LQKNFANFVPENASGDWFRFVKVKKSSRWSRNRRKGRVARWFISKPKIPFWVNFGRSFDERCCYVLWPFGIVYGQLVSFMPFGAFCAYLVYFLWFWYFVPRKSGNPAQGRSAETDNKKICIFSVIEIPTIFFFALS
jgi:hypothetical protein